MERLRIDEVTDLDRLGAAMAEVGDQTRQLADFAEAWVLRREAFETSDLCLLRPLGWVLGELAGALDDFVGSFRSGWEGLADDLAATRRDLADAEAEAAHLLLGLGA